MKTITTLVAGLLLAAASLLGGAQAVAAPAPTISGPATTPYYDVATVTGRADPGQRVDLYARRTGEAHFIRLHGHDAGAEGRYVIQVRILRRTAYYVRSASAQSRTVTTDLPPITCSTSPYVTNLPLGASPTATKDEPDFVAFTAARGATWAGSARRGDDLAVVAKSGGSPVRILGRFDYRGHTYSPRAGGSVTAVAVTPHGSVVANVQRTDTDLAADRQRALVWYGGAEHSLLAATDWASFEATGVSNNGTIVGYARIGTVDDAVFRVVVWSEHGTRFHVLAATGAQSPYPVVDRDGDIAWTGSDGYAVARTASGDQRELRRFPLSEPRGYSQHLVMEAAGESSLYAGPVRGTERWTPGDVEGPLAGELIGEYTRIYAVDPRGDLLVNGVAVPSQIRTASGSVVRMPAQLRIDHAHIAGAAFGSSGVIAYTAPDGLVHVMRCH